MRVKLDDRSRRLPTIRRRGRRSSADPSETTPSTRADWEEGRGTERREGRTERREGGQRGGKGDREEERGTERREGRTERKECEKRVDAWIAISNRPAISRRPLDDRTTTAEW
jgi:hypothetical protein